MNLNLKIYNAQNAPHKEEPKVNHHYKFAFNSKGWFIISRTLYEKMGNPAAVVICQDTQYPSDFYLRASKDPMAFRVVAGPRNQFRFRSNTLAGIIADAIKCPPPYMIRFQVTEKEDGLFCLATRKPAIKQYK